MTSLAYYNEIEPFAVEWLWELIKTGVIADGIVDARPIQEIEPSDLEGFTQVHFFAGIGGWSYALRLAGWPDDRPIWTGSCPCQPFSTAGKRKGFADDRHLWPFFYNLVVQSRPAIVVGEQVASPDGLAWLDTVSSDLEGSHYTVAAADLCAAGIGAPHIRQRLYWVGHAEGTTGRLPVRDERSLQDQLESGRTGEIGELGHHHHQRQQGRNGAELRERTDQLVAGATSASGGLADNGNAERRTISLNRKDGRDGEDSGREETHSEFGTCGEVRDVADNDRSRCAQGRSREESHRRNATRIESPRLRETGGFWSPADWIFCRDGKYRPVEPGTFPLAHGVPARVGRLRGYGNAIVPELAATFIRAFCEASGLDGRR